MTALKQVVAQLKKDGLVKTQAEIAGQVQQKSSYFSSVVNAKKPISVTLLKHLYHKFNININFIISGGKGEIYCSKLEEFMLEEGETPYQVIADYKSMKQEIISLKQQLNDKEKIIRLLEESGAKK